MPTLHLPAAHTDTDVALAAEIAGVVGSHELYVTWTHGEGAGLPPEIEAVLEEDMEGGPISPFAEVIVAMVQGISALWNAIVRPSQARAELDRPREDARPVPKHDWTRLAPTASSPRRRGTSRRLVVHDPSGRSRTLLA